MCLLLLVLEVHILAPEHNRSIKTQFQSVAPNKRCKKNPIILYAGQNLSEDYLADLFDVLDRYDYAINVISKSGTTTEPAVAFRI